MLGADADADADAANVDDFIGTWTLERTSIPDYVRRAYLDKKAN